jgi:hypothetical protein
MQDTGFKIQDAEPRFTTPKRHRSKLCPDPSGGFRFAQLASTIRVEAKRKGLRFHRSSKATPMVGTKTLAERTFKMQDSERHGLRNPPMESCILNLVSCILYPESWILHPESCLLHQNPIRSVHFTHPTSTPPPKTAPAHRARADTPRPLRCTVADAMSGARRSIRRAQ